MTMQPTRPKRVDANEPQAQPRRSRADLFELAYHRIEELPGKCAVAPGRFPVMHSLQGIVGFGRAPVHHPLAVLDAVVTRYAARAVATFGEPIAFVDGLFDKMETRIAPARLDRSVGPRPIS